MKRVLSLPFVIGAIVALVLLAYMFTYQVQYNQVAVLTTFGKATAASVQTAPGFYFRLPWPVQEVHAFTSRLQVMDTVLEQTTTRDNKTIVVRTSVTWHVSDPLNYLKLGDVSMTESRLKPLVLGARSVFAKYDFNQLVARDTTEAGATTQPETSKLPQIADEMAAQLRADIAAQNYGIEVDDVQIRRLVLPETVSDAVLKAMATVRERKSIDALAQGDAEANKIEGEAKADRERIMAFADSRATAIRAQGQRIAAESYKAFAADPDLAAFMRYIDMIKKSLAHNTTFVLRADELGLSNILKNEANRKFGATRPARDE